MTEPTQSVPTVPGTLELTILMPCLNEAETLGICIRKALHHLQRSGTAGEILVADNGSTDGSQQIARTLGARVIDVPQRGYGAAVRAGIRAARGRYVVMGDADDSYDFLHLDAFVGQLRAGADLVMGNRFKGGIERGAMPLLHKYLGNPVLSALGRLFYRSPIGDFHCGLRGFDRLAIESLKLTSPGMEFASEMVVKATLQGKRIVEVPTRLAKDGRSRPPHLRSWRDGWRHLRFLMLFSPKWLFLYPGLWLFAAGAASMAWLLPSPQSLLGITLDVNTLAFSAAAIICGFQAFFFSVFAQIVGSQAKLLPRDPLVDKLKSWWTLENGVAAGAALFAAGLTAALYAVGFWRHRSFGPLDPAVSLRIVLPAVTALILGLQLVFSSCFLSVLGLSGERPDDEGPEA